MLEVLWSSLPPTPPPPLTGTTEVGNMGGLDLYEVKFRPGLNPSSPASASPKSNTKDTAYTRLRAIRRQSSSASGSPLQKLATPLPTSHSMDVTTEFENSGRSACKQQLSLDLNPLGKKSDPINIRSLRKSDSVNSPLRQDPGSDNSPKRLIKNLNEFLNFLPSPTKVKNIKDTVEKGKEFKDDGAISSKERNYNLYSSALIAQDNNKIKSNSSSQNSSRKDSLKISPAFDDEAADMSLGDQSSNEEVSEYSPLNIPMVHELNLQLEKLDHQIQNVQPKKATDETFSSEAEFDKIDGPNKASVSALELLERSPLKRCSSVKGVPSSSQNNHPSSHVDTSKDLTIELMSTNSVDSSFHDAKENRESIGFLEKNRPGATPITINLPPPEEFGGANPFLMFLCLTLLLQHRDNVMRSSMDYNEIAMYFDKLVRRHNVNRVLAQARSMFSQYLRQDWKGYQKNKNTDDLV